jgi:LytR cell envelope-related transcriptional attenuator
MARRHITTAVTLLVLVGILVLGALVGAKSLFAPLPGDSGTAVAPTPTCTTKTVRKGQRIRSAQVQVSVYNGGGRSGLADETMTALRKRGFTEGEVGNAPTRLRVKRVRVMTTERNDMAALLVARQFGSGTRVTLSTTDLGPGIDVIVGDGFKKLARAKHVIVARRASSACVPLPADTATGTGTAGS